MVEQKQSDLTAVVLDIAQEIKQMREEVKGQEAVPFMEERVTLPQARRRLQQMSSEERGLLLQKFGIEKMMRIIKSGRG